MTLCLASPAPVPYLGFTFLEKRALSPLHELRWGRCGEPATGANADGWKLPKAAAVARRVLDATGSSSEGIRYCQAAWGRHASLCGMLCALPEGRIERLWPIVLRV